jgi:hypothetical protein
MTLIERLQSAGADEQRELLVEVWDAIAPSFDRAGLIDKAHRFSIMLDAEAWESAALMLVEDNMAVDVTLRWREAPARARLLPVYEASPGRWLHKGSDPHFCANATTPALAIAAACLKARESVQ